MGLWVGHMTLVSTLVSRRWTIVATALGGKIAYYLLSPGLDKSDTGAKVLTLHVVDPTRDKPQVLLVCPLPNEIQ